MKGDNERTTQLKGVFCLVVHGEGVVDVQVYSWMYVTMGLVSPLFEFDINFFVFLLAYGFFVKGIRHG